MPRGRRMTAVGGATVAVVLASVAARLRFERQREHSRHDVGGQALCLLHVRIAARGQLVLDVRARPQPGSPATRAHRAADLLGRARRADSPVQAIRGGPPRGGQARRRGADAGAPGRLEAAGAGSVAGGLLGLPGTRRGLPDRDARRSERAHRRHAGRRARRRERVPISRAFTASNTDSGPVPRRSRSPRRPRSSRATSPRWPRSCRAHQLTPLEYTLRAHEILEDALRDQLSGDRRARERRRRARNRGGADGDRTRAGDDVSAGASGPGLRRGPDRTADRIRTGRPALRVHHASNARTADTCPLATTGSARASARRSRRALGGALEALAQVPATLETEPAPKPIQIPKSDEKIDP